MTRSMVPVVQDGRLTLAGCTGSGPIHLVDEREERSGYEPAVAAALASDLGLQLQWISLEWADLYPALIDGRIDGVMYNQSITVERRKTADFTVPYGNFHESLLVRLDSDVREPGDLGGRRIGAVRGTTNMTVALAVGGLGDADVVDFEGSVDGFHAMVEALRSGEIDALVDDELYLRQYESSGFRIAFTVLTGNAYGIALRSGSPLTRALDEALTRLGDSGELEAMWTAALPGVAYQRPQLHGERDVDALTRFMGTPGAVRLHQ